MRDADIFPNALVGEKNRAYQFRLAVKAIVFDSQNKLALVGKKWWLLPGGGVEEGESLVEAVRREIEEEVGCDIKIGDEIAVTDEYREKIKRHQETHFFLASVIGEKGIPQTIEENEQGMKVSWLTLAEAVQLLEEQVETMPFENYNACFNVRTQLAVLRQLQDL